MDAVEDVKSRLSVEDVIGEYVELKRAGRSLKGLSPFNSEKTPSFMVSPEKQIWHDFSSGKGGNMFSFVMEMEGLDFRGALELLAKKAGIDLDQYQRSRTKGAGKAKERLGQALEAAAKFYQVQFSNHKTAIDYIFKQRKFKKDTVLEFRIGYSPNTGKALVDYLSKKSFSEQEIKQAGLSASRYKGAADMFRGRIMIPLQDSFGNVIGFTARLLEDNPDAPKYINTPQTPLYDKSRHVYGLHLAKESIRKSNYVVVAEGNLDVIASHQANVKNVVATAGTAMTEQHLKELSRFTKDIRLAFDQDQAGLNAMERIVPLASKLEINLSIISIPSGKDPDELIQKDVKLWQKTIEQPEYALDWLIRRHQSQVDITSAAGKKALSDTILPLLRQLRDPVEQDHYLSRLSELLGVDKEALRSKLKDSGKQVKFRPKKTANLQPMNRADTDVIKTQNQLLSLCLNNVELKDNLTVLNKDMFQDRAADFFELLMNNNDKKIEAFLQSKTPGSDEKAVRLQNLRDYGKMLQVLYEELYQNLEYVELKFEAARLQVRLVERYVKSQKRNIGLALETASADQAARLQAQDKKLNDLLKRAKEQ